MPQGDKGLVNKKGKYKQEKKEASYKKQKEASDNARMSQESKEDYYMTGQNVEHVSQMIV